MKKLITEKDVQAIINDGKAEIVVRSDSVLTPLAKDRIKSAGLTILESDEHLLRRHASDQTEQKIFYKAAIGGDHTGFEIKNKMKSFLEQKGIKIIDVGTNSHVSCDYPDFAHLASSKVAMREVDFAIIFDATGIPSAITANKIPGIRAATCYNEFSAKSARSHNNANVLVIGAKTLGEETIKSIIETWLKTDFEGGRHQKRLDKIRAIEDKYTGKIPFSD
ncbi:MAG: ribose 5-phosphate isomerase B [Melioribacteraceae bacterium]|nr:ribose 5-phosphate isomerase B [Melioribacteraceae bacterium]MCF8264267.1 ribose 5-phosphate isomerase B [Melioribacteraceae bacterium]MCF8413399.1 ribose 5-phosphate isomerase B [Melioribacteraceae bacterium]MCF8431767.1 ribose 5-phosphate isomerase B [Melioribacteraceae bacterium]